MRYDLSLFKKEAQQYKTLLKQHRVGDDILVIFDIDDERSFYSIAPLSLAVHELGKEMAVLDSGNNSIDVLRNFWNLKSQLDSGIKNSQTIALKRFLDIVDKKTKNEFKKIAIPPKTVFIAKKGKWTILSTEEFLKGNKNNSGTFFTEARNSWLDKSKWKPLLKTADILWNQTYNLKKSEIALCDFELISAETIRKKPLEDKLDSFQIVYAMAVAGRKLCRRVSIESESAKKSVLDFPEKISDLSATLLGCELDKNADEQIFSKFKKLSPLIAAHRLKPADAIFLVKGEGYSGKHIFGQHIGYPTLNKKARWETPLRLAMKLPWYPQTKDESRKPMTRLMLSDTIPLDIFIETNNIDWFALERRNRKIMAIIERSDLIKVKGKETRCGQTDFIVHIKNDKTGKRRHPLSSGTDAREKIDRDFLKQGIVGGAYGNIPGGEAFMNPEYIKGTFIGDVVIAIDRSYVIPKNAPLVIKCNEHGHRIISGDKKIISILNKKRDESLKQLRDMERNGAISKEIAELKKKNFHNVGEFAINTNPKARLCDYLIVNEKIANMMHIALGSGFDADRASTYHYDIVINAKAQEMDVYGEKDGKTIWILKKGKFVV